MTNPGGGALRKWSKDSVNNPPATKCPRHQRLTRNNILKIVKLVLDTINDDKTQNNVANGEKIPTMGEVKVESVSQELWNNKGMEFMLHIQHTCTQNLHIDACSY